MLDRNHDGRIDLDDLKLFIEEVDQYSDAFISNEPTKEALDHIKDLILPMVDFLDRFADIGMENITEIRDDWKKFIDMLDDGENIFTVAAQFKKTIDETRENIEEIAEQINQAKEHVEAARSFIAKFREEAPKAIAEFKADTKAINDDKADEFEAMRKYWAEGNKAESIKIFFKDGTEYVVRQTAEFFDLLGDLAKAGANSLKHAHDSSHTDTDPALKVELVATVDTHNDDA